MCTSKFGAGSPESNPTYFVCMASVTSKQKWTKEFHNQLTTINFWTDTVRTAAVSTEAAKLIPYKLQPLYFLNMEIGPQVLLYHLT